MKKKQQLSLAEARALGRPLAAGWKPELGERGCWGWGLWWVWGWGSRASLLPSGTAAGAGLSFRRADARCHTEEGYCMGSWLPPLPDEREDGGSRGGWRGGGDGDDDSLRKSTPPPPFYVVFTSFSCSCGLTRNKPAAMRTSAATAN